LLYCPLLRVSDRIKTKPNVFILYTTIIPSCRKETKSTAEKLA
jgi:hypothetical protein